MGTIGVLGGGLTAALATLALGGLVLELGGRDAFFRLVRRDLGGLGGSGDFAGSTPSRSAAGG